MNLHNFSILLMPLDIVHKLPERIALFDAQHRFVGGNPKAAEDGATIKPVVREGQTVGYVHVIPVPDEALFGSPDIRETQQLLFWGVILAAAALAGGIAWATARHWSRPLHSMAAATRQLAAGRYELRLPDRRPDELGELAADINTLAANLQRYRDSRRQRETPTAWRSCSATCWKIPPATPIRADASIWRWPSRTAPW
jgi:two-component system sensor histidine kinase BaeS